MRSNKKLIELNQIDKPIRNLHKQSIGLRRVKILLQTQQSISNHYRKYHLKQYINPNKT